MNVDRANIVATVLQLQAYLDDDNTRPKWLSIDYIRGQRDALNWIISITPEA